MIKLNQVEIESPWGYRSFELYNGDITQLNTNVDLLAISAFKNSFKPSPGSVIGEIYSRYRIDLYNCRETVFWICEILLDVGYQNHWKTRILSTSYVRK